MNKNEIFITLQQIVRDVVGDKELKIHNDSELAEIEGWDSTANIEILIEIESKFNIRFESDEIATLDSMGSIINGIFLKINDK